MEQVLAAKRRAERFEQLFQMIGEGFTEYIAFGELCLRKDRPKSEEEEEADEGEEEKHFQQRPLQHSHGSQGGSGAEDDHDQHDQQLDQDHHQQLQLMDNHRLYKLHAQRLAKLHLDYSKWRARLDRDSSRLFHSANPTQSAPFRPTFSRFAPPLLFCRCPSSQRRNPRLYRPSSSHSLQLNPERGGKAGGEEAEVGQGSRLKSQSFLVLNCSKSSGQEEAKEEAKETEKEAEAEEADSSPRTALAAMTAIESELCGMLGRLQLHVEGILGFARLGTGDVFEVSIRHGHQRWRTRGKTQADKSQQWDQQPPATCLNIFWNMPVQVKVLEVGFLRSRCLNERQFDPAKFASAQSQLVTMNLNSAGSIKLRLLVNWLPLLSSKPMGGNGILMGLDQNRLEKEHMVKQQQNQQQMNQQQQLSQQNAMQNGRLPPKVPPKRNQSLNAGPFPSPASPVHQQPGENANNATAGASPVKVCLRDKKRQREQRIQMGMSVATSSLSAGIGREASKTDKQRWRCSSTTLLDEVYKDLAKSIPTIDDLSALHAKSESIGGSLGPSGGAHRSFNSESLAAPSGGDFPCSSSSISEGRSKSGAKRIFSFVKRASDGGRRQKEEWRKSISLGQIAPERGEQEQNKLEMNQPEEPEQFRDSARNGPKMGLNGGTGSGAAQRGSAGGSARRAKLASLKKGRSFDHGQEGEPLPAVMDTGVNKSKELEQALRTVEALLARIETLRALLTKLRSAEFPELVGFEAAMLNWEACLKLNRSGILCQLEGRLANGAEEEPLRPGRAGTSGQMAMRQRLANNRHSLFPMAQQQHSPSSASDETDESGAKSSSNGTGQHNDQISENDSGIDSLRQYHSPYNSSSGSSSKWRPPAQQNGGTSANAALANEPMNSRLAKERRKSIGAMLDLVQNQHDHTGLGPQPLSATGTPQMDKCLGIHLRRAEQALQAILDVQASPFEYTLTKMLCQIEGVETVALESMLGLVQDLLAQCQPSAQNVLLQLGLQFQLQQCWLSACQQFDAFLLAPLGQVRAQLRPLCEPIVRSRYPKLVDKVMDSLCALLADGIPASSSSQNCANTEPISLFQFLALFRAKQFPAFIENLSHEAWISANLQSGHPGPIREVMERLRNVPVVPPLESLRHIGLVLARQQQTPIVTAPIEKYLRKASPELALDLAACFLCLLEHAEETSRSGACRALAILGQENSLRCLDFLSRSDTSARVRAEAKSACAQVRRSVQKEMTKI